MQTTAMSYDRGVWRATTGERAELHTEPHWCDVVTVRAVIDGGRRAHIEFKSGAQLTVPTHLLKEHR